MNIERLSIGAFGALTGLDTGEAPLPTLVVVLGPNEAGKSTVAEFLTTALYGFSPASRERNPYVPWGGDEAWGSVRIRLADETTVEVSRRLRAQPMGRVEGGGRVEDLRNQPVPWAEHVPRSVYRQVFSINLRDLAALDGETWARIEDRIVGSMGASDLRPAREVADELEREAGELWRPNRRGNQRIRIARARMRELRGRRLDATDRDRELRARAEELATVRTRLAQLRAERAREQEGLERLETLVPVRASLLRIEELRQEGGPTERLDGIPPEPRARLEELRENVQRLEGLLAMNERARTELIEVGEGFGKRERAVLAARDDITGFAASVGRIASDRDRCVELRAELDSLMEGLDRAAREILGVPWNEAPRKDLLAVAPGAIGAAVGRVSEARRLVRASEEEASRGSHPDSPWPRSLLWSGVTIVIGGALILLGFAWGAAWLGALGAAVISVGVTTFAVGVRSGTRARRTRREADGKRDRARSALEKERRSFESLTAPLPLVERHAREPDGSLTEALGRLHDLEPRHRRATRTLTELEGRLMEMTERGRSLAQSLSLPPGVAEHPDQVAALLVDRSRVAERAEQAADAARREFDRLEADRDRLKVEVGTARADLEALERAARRFGDDDLSSALDRAARSREAHRAADRLELELGRQHPDLPALRARIDEAERTGEAWTAGETGTAAVHERIRALTEEIEALAVRGKELAATIDHAGGLETVDAVDSEIAALEEEIGLWNRQRDRAWLLGRLVREADRRFRERHQPDLLRRAGLHISHLTTGRYARIAVEEIGGTGTFQLAGAALADPVTLDHPISTGTLEQAYLALRMAIVDHLDPNGEKLPLFLDELFVNWDPERRRAGIDLLGRASRTRQIFFFTCHPPIAEELEDAGARVVRLEDPS